MDSSAKWNKNHIWDADKQDMMLKRFPFCKRKLAAQGGRKNPGLRCGKLEFQL